MKTISYTCKMMSYISLIDTRGVTMHLAHEMRQNTDAWFTIFNTISNKFSMTEYLSFNHKK